MGKLICAFVGTFNPPSNSHFYLAQQIINDNENIEKVIFIPVSSKYNKPGLIEDKHRYNMLKKVCEKNDKFEVSDIEFNLEKQPYTIETLEKLQKNYSNKEIVFTIGTDNLKELETWHKAKELVKKFKVIVLARNEDNIEKIIQENEFLNNNKSSFIILKSQIRTNLSSTYIRNQIKQSKSIRYLLPDEVLIYINENNLYKEI